MSMQTLERAIRDELRVIVKNPRLKIEDMMEWSTSETVVRKSACKDEVVVRCSLCWVAIKKSDDKRSTIEK